MIDHLSTNQPSTHKSNILTHHAPINHTSIHSINPYLDIFNPQPSIHQITDRFLPSRKLIKKESFTFDDQQDTVNNENIQAQPQSTTYQVCDIYKKLIMNQLDTNDSLFNVYQNKNMLKYTTKVTSCITDVPFTLKNSTLPFGKELLGKSNGCRKINKIPYKVLDAPALQDDYYLNLIDWSTQNLLGVGLASSVYLWNGQNSKVSKLCDLGTIDTVTSVCWSLKGPHLAVGANSGEVQIWDVNKMKKVRTLYGHTNRVGAISWNSSVLSTGSRDKTILQRDLRLQSSFFSKLEGHKQQICGLKWSFDEQQLCSGGNDNKLFIWNSHSQQPILKFNDHLAAVKALAWSPHQHGLLVSGGGTADRTIKFRNTLSGTTIKSMDVGSQVCNLMFSKTQNQLVSTHGYSQNEINIWKYPQMKKISTLTGHTFRVLYLAMSPDGQTIVTGAGDQTLRFWNAFPHKNDNKNKSYSQLSIECSKIR